MTTPNIFDYATKELSQDAVIAWLVACGRHAQDPLRKCGLEFIAALFRSGAGRVIDRKRKACDKYAGPAAVTEVLCGPKLQYDKIDVYFQARVDGHTVSFLVEDKVTSQMHGGQLDRYLKIVQKDKIQEELIKPIYLKTEYIFSDEREIAEKANYSVFDCDDMRRFLCGRRSDTHEILRQFEEHLTRKKKDQDCALREWKLDHDFVQWEFMVHLKERLRIGEKLPSRGRNRGGGAWTQYPDWQLWEPPLEELRKLFWRLDAWKPLRLIVQTENVSGWRDELWDGWSRAFDEASHHVGLRKEIFRSNRRRGGKWVSEGTIGAVAIEDYLRDNGLEAGANQVAALHRKFVELTNPEDACVSR